MPLKGSSLRRSRASKANYAKQERNEFNEFAPGFRPLAKETETERTETAVSACGKIAQGVLALASATLTLTPDDRETRTVVRGTVSDIREQLTVISDALTEAADSKQKNDQLQAQWMDRLQSLPPELSVDQTETLQILKKVNEGREKKLSTFLIEKLLTNDPKEINRLHSLNRKLLVKVETLQEAQKQFKEKSNKKCDALKTQRKRTNTRISSPEYRQQVTKEVVRESIKGTHGYTTTFKNGVVNLQSHCSSINSTPEALDDIYKAVLPFMDEAERKNLTPDRKSVQNWTKGGYDGRQIDVINVNKLMPSMSELMLFGPFVSKKVTVNSN